MGTFHSAVECYELLTNARARLEREGPFLLDALDRAPGSRCIDLACGTGLHALYLAEHGARVHASDLSPSMIAFAQEHRSHARVTYAVGDMREPPDGPWDLAICLGNSLSLLQNEADLSNLLERLRPRLIPGGLFLFQTLNYRATQARQPRHRVESASSGQANLVAVKSLVPRGKHTLLTLNYFVERADRQVDAFSETATLRNWNHEELTAMARTAGYEVAALCGGFDGSAFDPDTSPDVVALTTIP